MPKAVLPTNIRGWLSALLASFVGFVSGFIVIRLLGDRWK